MFTFGYKNQPHLSELVISTKKPSFAQYRQILIVMCLKFYLRNSLIRTFPLVSIGVKEEVARE